MASATVTLLLFLLFASAVSPSHADAEFIANTCKKTQNPSLCVDFLTEDGRGLDATTVADLARVNVEHDNDAATDNWADIGNLYDFSRLSTPPGSPQFIEALKNCVSLYAGARSDLDNVRGELDSARYSVARDLVIHASSAAWKCEAGFTQEESPLTKRNKNFVDGCVVSNDLITLLLT